jgi:hypothetical protein
MYHLPGHGFTALRWGSPGRLSPVSLPKGVFARGDPFDGSYEASAGFPVGASFFMEGGRILVANLRKRALHYVVYSDNAATWLRVPVEVARLRI